VFLLGLFRVKIWGYCRDSEEGVKIEVRIYNFSVFNRKSELNGTTSDMLKACRFVFFRGKAVAGQEQPSGTKKKTTSLFSRSSYHTAGDRLTQVLRFSPSFPSHYIIRSHLSNAVSIKG
jgi:hypothetical protein